MLKIIGIVMVFAAFSLSGLALSSAVKKKYERLCSMKKMTSDIAALIRYKSLTLREIFLSLSENSSYSNMDFIGYTAAADRFAPFSKAWDEGVERDKELSAEEKDLLKKLGGDLGGTDIEGQLAVLSLYGEKFGELAAEEKEKYRQKGKMYRSLGVLFGAMAGILFV